MAKKKHRFIREIESKKGTISYRVFIRFNGQTFSKCVCTSDFDTKGQALNEAIRIRDEALVKMRTGYTVSNFKTVADIYNETFTILPVRMKTKIKHDYFFKYGIQPYADKPIDKITSGDIQKSLNKYAKDHTKRQVQGLLAIWRRIYKTAAMLNINVIDRTIAVVMPECMKGTPRKKTISPEDLETFCSTLWDYNAGSHKSRSVYYAIRVMQYCGLRPQEAFALMKSDIDLISGTISINKSVHSTVDSMLDIGNTKTDTSVREVPIPDQLRPYLTDCMKRTVNDFLFTDRAGNLLSIDYIDMLVRNVCKQAKVYFTLYQLRHQFSTDLLNSGIPVHTVRDLMGHTSATMSVDYAVSNENDRKEAVNNRKFS